MFIEAMDGEDCRVKGRLSAGINIAPKFSWSVLLSRALWGLERGAERSFPFLCRRHRDAKQIIKHQSSNLNK